MKKHNADYFKTCRLGELISMLNETTTVRGTPFAFSEIVRMITKAFSYNVDEEGLVKDLKKARQYAERINADVGYRDDYIKMIDAILEWHEMDVR